MQRQQLQTLCRRSGGGRRSKPTHRRRRAEVQVQERWGGCRSEDGKRTAPAAERRWLTFERGRRRPRWGKRRGTERAEVHDALPASSSPKRCRERPSRGLSEEAQGAALTASSGLTLRTAPTWLTTGNESRRPRASGQRRAEAVATASTERTATRTHREVGRTGAAIDDEVEQSSDHTTHPPLAVM